MKTCCPNCGHNVDASLGQTSCSECGAELKPAVPSSTQQVSAPPPAFTQQSLENAKTKKAKDLLYSLIVIIIIVLILLVDPIGGCQGFSYGEEEKTGTIYNISKKGRTYITWEGELQYRSPNGGAQRYFAFSISSNAVAEKVYEAHWNGDYVTIRYNRFIGRSRSLGETRYDVTDIRRGESGILLHDAEKRVAPWLGYPDWRRRFPFEPIPPRK